MIPDVICLHLKSAGNSNHNLKIGTSSGEFGEDFLNADRAHIWYKPVFYTSRIRHFVSQYRNKTLKCFL